MQILADYHNQQQLTRTLKLMNLRMFQVHKILKAKLFNDRDEIPSLQPGDYYFSNSSVVF